MNTQRACNTFHLEQHHQQQHDDEDNSLPFVMNFGKIRKLRPASRSLTFPPSFNKEEEEDVCSSSNFEKRELTKNQTDRHNHNSTVIPSTSPSNKKTPKEEEEEEASSPPPLVKEENEDKKHPSFKTCETLNSSLLLSIKEEQEQEEEDQQQQEEDEEEEKEDDAEKEEKGGNDEETRIIIEIDSSILLLPSKLEPQQKKMRFLIDYEKNRCNDYERVIPQGHVPTEFKASKKNTFYMPTCFSLDKRLEETFHRRFVDNDNDSSCMDPSDEDHNEEDRVDFIFKVIPKHQRRRRSISVSSINNARFNAEASQFPIKAFLGKQGKQKSADSILLRRRSNHDSFVPRKSAIIKQLLRKSKKGRGNSNSCSNVYSDDNSWESKKYRRYESVIAAEATAAAWTAAAAEEGTNENAIIPESIQIPSKKKRSKWYETSDLPTNKLRTAIMAASFASKLKSKVASKMLTRKWSSNTATSKMTVETATTTQSTASNITLPTFEMSPSAIKQSNDAAFNALHTAVLAASFARKLKAKVAASSKMTSSLEEAAAAALESTTTAAALASSSTVSGSIFLKSDEQPCDAANNEAHSSVEQSKCFNKNTSTLERTWTSYSSDSKIAKENNNDNKSPTSDQILLSMKTAKTPRKKSRDGAFNALRTTVLAASFAKKLRSRAAISHYQKQQ